MIKYASFKFEELQVKDHWVTFSVFGPCIGVEVRYEQDYHNVDIHLSPEEYYQISLDQSTSNTGLFIKNYKNTEAYMVEISRAGQAKGSQNAGDYIFDLEMFLHRLFENVKITHMIYEKPISTKNYESNRVLFQLEGMLLNLARRYPEFGTAKIDCIENASWRSVVIDKQLSSTYSRKELSRISVQNTWTWTRHYDMSLKSDEDIYEAIGVMMGWFYKSFDSLGRPYVRGDTHRSRVGVYVLPGYHGEEIKKLLEEQGIKCKFAVENPNYTIYNNLSSMIEDKTVLCVEFTSQYAMLCLCIESNIKWDNYEYMTVLLSDAANVDSKLKEVAGGDFHFTL